MGGWRRVGVVVSVLLVVVALGAAGASGAQERQPRTWNTELVGQLAPPQDGGYADVWAHKDVAYLGNLRQVDCRPANGVWAIDLGDPADSATYASAEVTAPGGAPNDTIRIRGEPIVYALSIPTAAPNERYAERFVRFLFSEDGQGVLRAAAVETLNPPTVAGTDVPRSIVALLGSTPPMDSVVATDTLGKPSVPKPSRGDTARARLDRRP